MAEEIKSLAHNNGEDKRRQLDKAVSKMCLGSLIMACFQVIDVVQIVRRLS